MTTATKRSDPPPPSDEEAPDKGGSSLERVTVNLTPRSAKAMNDLAELRGETKTEVINKALQFFSHMQMFVYSGGALYMRDPDSTEMDRVKIF